MPALPSLATLIGRLDAGEVSSAALVADTLDRVHASQPVLNAFRLVRDEGARVDAEAADRRRAAGERGPLLGVPIAIKDDADLCGEPTAFGCAGPFPPKQADAEVVRRLRAAGAVIVGKTNTPEFGQWPFTEGAAFGVTRNPWELGHTPGGSSGGSAAAVAAGLVVGAIGSDGAGSVRIPAAWSHLVGIKPQRGRISSWPDPEAFHGLTVNGPLARTVADAALLLDAASGPHPGDRHVAPPPAEPYRLAATRPPGRLRIGLSLRAPFTGMAVSLDGEIRAAVERLAEVCGALGHEVLPADPDYRLIGLNFMPRSHAGLADWVTRVPDESLLDPRTRANGRTGRLLGGVALRAARGAEGRLRHRIGAVFERVDVLLAPTTALPPLPVGRCDGLSNWATDQAVVAACPYAWPWNVVGWPAVNVPAGFTASGLPVGAQLLGPADSEARLISLAAQLEDVERWGDDVPPHAFVAGTP